MVFVFFLSENVEDLPANIKKELMKQEKKRKNGQELKPGAKKAKLANNVQGKSPYMFVT
jgi:hypothetical protein